MKNQKHLPNRKQLISEIEAELGITIGEWEWTNEEIEDMHTLMIGSMHNSIRWNLRDEIEAKLDE